MPKAPEAVTAQDFTEEMIYVDDETRSRKKYLKRRDTLPPTVSISIPLKVSTSGTLKYLGILTLHSASRQA